MFSTCLFLTIHVLDRLRPGEQGPICLDRQTASHQHFLQFSHCEVRISVNLPGLQVNLWKAVCKMFRIMKFLPVAAEVGGILSIETATLANFES